MFASDVVRYVGEPVAAVAADHPETCRRALAAIVVDYELLDPLLDPEAAIDGSHPPIHPDGNVIRHQRIVCGDQSLVGDVVVERVDRPVEPTQRPPRRHGQQRTEQTGHDERGAHVEPPDEQ